MNKWTNMLAAAGLVATSFGALTGCAVKTDDDVVQTGQVTSGPVTTRRVTVEVDSCNLDVWQKETLYSDAARKVIQEVVLMCLVPSADGSVGPDDDSAEEAQLATYQELHKLGYRVSLGVSFTDESGERFDGVQTASWLAKADWRANVEQAIAKHALACDAFDLDFERLPDEAIDYLTAFVSELDPVVRPGNALGIFTLPQTTTPSDVSGAGAFLLPELIPHVDRIRVATLDYSVGTPGPTVDSGWAVDALRFAEKQDITPTDNIAFDIAAPLYGWDFSNGAQRSVTYDESIGLMTAYGADLTRTAAGEPTFSYADADHLAHTVFFDDAESTMTTLRAWTPATVDVNVGVVLWGFGAEDPAIWQVLANAESGVQQ